METSVRSARGSQCDKNIGNLSFSSKKCLKGCEIHSLSYMYMPSSSEHTGFLSVISVTDRNPVGSDDELFLIVFNITYKHF